MTYKSIDIANSTFVGYTEPRLLKRQVYLNSIINDPEGDDWEIIEAVRHRMEVKECLKLFDDVRELGLDPSGMTACDLIETVSGERIERLQKQTAGGVLASDMMQRTGEVLKKTGAVTKEKTNIFAKWLAEKTS